ncbi:MAG: RluA family pseudouridine synthase [Clostridiales bacterium]|jgi:23S rRNA pseudouridine955/2504/2580 synthase|nr:RluA family pseudouridine synthase [Clostridiales bacterium]
MREIIIDENNAGGRADKYLLKYLNLAPKNFIYKTLRKKNITLNGRKAFGHEILRKGDALRFFISDAVLDSFISRKTAPKTRLKPDIVYEDENILVCNKPRGVLSQPSGVNGQRAMTDIALSYLSGNGFDLNAPFTPAFVNRLDMNTSGIMTCGKTLASTRWLAAAIAEGKAEKRYIAVARGNIKTDGVINLPLTKSQYHRKAEISGENAKGFKNALTVYKPLEHAGGYTLVEISLKTGRFHQIRAHFSAIGHPIAGDVKYGFSPASGSPRDRVSHALHAVSAQYHEPEGILGYIARKCFVASPPPEFTRQIKAMGFSTDKFA